MPSCYTAGRQTATVTSASSFVVARVRRHHHRRGIGGMEDYDNEEEELDGRALMREAGDGNHDSEEDDDDDEGRLDDNNNVGHVCALYRAISYGSFCPRARHILLPVPVLLDDDGGGDARDNGDVSITPSVLPRISVLSVRQSRLCPRCCGPRMCGSWRAGICLTCRMTSEGWTIALRSSIPLPRRTTTTATTGGI